YKKKKKVDYKIKNCKKNSVLIQLIFNIGHNKIENY
ncbi:hypothetical protein QGC_1190, partial [Clostridioides difficile CD196]